MSEFNIPPRLFSHGSPHVICGENRSIKNPDRTQQHLIKAYDVLRDRHKTLILGSSGMGIGVYAHKP